MDSQQQYEALLTQWGFDTESQHTANKLYEFNKKVSFSVKRFVNTLTSSFNSKPQNLQLGLSH